ncbi:uncharacterized protein [Epargyreus clarus]|uniref:uncharacterized protein n=1 Tax=Epargyreus clarus TaxID=520877 RepID=UPI003C2DC048
MEENSEAQMDTDVASTQDVSEAQEVAGSHGDMETVIVVEQLKEEDSAAEFANKTPQAEQPDTSNKETTDKASPTAVETKSPPKTVQCLSTSPQKEIKLSLPKDIPVIRIKTYSRSPIKDHKNLLISPKKPEQSEDVQSQATSDCSKNENKTSPETKLLVISPEKGKLFATSPEKGKLLVTPHEKCKLLATSSEKGKLLVTSPEKGKLLVTSPEKGKLPVTSSEKGKLLVTSLEKGKLPVTSSEKGKLLVTSPEKGKLLVTSPEKGNFPATAPEKDKLLATSPEGKLSETCLEKEKSAPDDASQSVETSPTKSDPSVHKTLLGNPLLVNALFGQPDKNADTSTKEVQKEVESESPPVEPLPEKPETVLEATSDGTEHHNKSISRELKSLINSAKESKIISECTQLTTKTRKSRTALDSSNTTLNSLDVDRPVGSRRSSDNSQISNGEVPEKTSLKRSMRSQNPEFVNKVKLFLNSVTGKITKTDADSLSDEEAEDKKSKDNPNEAQTESPNKKKPGSDGELTPAKMGKIRSDPYCWRCHWSVEQEPNDKQHSPMVCTVCPRSFHYKCLSGTERSKIISEKNWVCPECLIVLHAESSETRSQAMKRISLGCLCDLLKHALARMMDLNGVEPFMQPVDRVAFPDYVKYVVHPMDLALMKANISEGLYGSTEAFLADAQWILHNSIIFNTCDEVVSVQSKLTAAARALVRSCKAEMGEIEACPECYAAAHSRKPTWFTDVCTTPHMLLWAKLKGFPYWPAKCMSVSSAGLVDVRFFGAHDRAWVPARDCFLFSEKDPNNFRTKRQDILDSMQEAEQHIRNISRKYGKFVYPPFKTQLDPSKLTEQLKIMIPSFEGELRAPVNKSTPKPAKNKSRSNSKSSKSSSNDGEVSDSEDATRSQPRKMADGAEIAMEDDFTIDKDKTMEVDEKPKEMNENSRKRRRSDMEEAVITIMEGPKEKRKCVENEPKLDEKLPDSQETNDKEKDDSKEQKAGVVEKTEYNEVKMISTLTPVSEKDLLNNSAMEERKRPPIKMILKANRTFKAISPKGKNIRVKVSPLRLRPLRIEKKSIDKEKQEDKKTHKRRNSKNKSLNIIANSPNADKNGEIKTSVVNSAESKDEEKDNASKVIEKPEDTNVAKSDDAVPPVNNVKPVENDAKVKEDEKVNNIGTKSKETEVPKGNSTKSKEPVKPKETMKSKENNTKTKDTEKSKDNNKTKENQKTKNTPKSKDTEGNQTIDKIKNNSTSSPITTKDTIQREDDNTSVTKKSRESLKRGSLTGLPTISSVRSLSSPQTVEVTPKTKVSDIAIDRSVFTPTSTDSVRNMKDAVIKLNKLKGDTNQSLVGKVGVCAFARMPSTPPSDKTKPNEPVEVEIKTEPMDFDDADRQVEKMNLMNSFSLRPVTSAPSSSPSLREVRINKVVSTAPVRKPAKPVDAKNRAKKTFQQKKGEEGRSDLNGKNSMVYIPIQPPATEAPVRMLRPVTVNGSTVTVPVPRTVATVTTSNSGTIVNPSTSTQLVVPPTPVVSTPSPFPAVGQIPTTVHTVPLITSLNGQWTFSLQPIMSVGGVDAQDGEATTPLLNGLSTNGALPMQQLSGIQQLPITNCPNPVQYPIVAKPLVPTVAPTNTPPPNMLPQQLPMLQSAQGCPLTMTNMQNTQASPLVLGNMQSVQPSPIVSASRPCEDNVGEPPRLQHKPLMNPFDANAPLGNVPPPSSAGPVTAKLNQNAIKLTDFFRTILEDTIDKLDEPAAEVTGLKLQLEESRWRHQQEIDELKHNHELMLAEIRASFEKERVRLVNETRCAAQLDLEAAVKLAKSKQWCANCSQEAQFYCCWNTSYCDYACQRAHWAQHYVVCTQQRTQDSNTNTDTESNSVNNRLQSSSDNVPKPPAPALSKATVQRVFNNEQQAGSKSSIIVSRVEDPSGGTPTVKCVGTYKPNPAAQLPAQVSPIILNKPIINNEDITASKKVVTSGGYLIVGGTSPAPLVTPPRRPQTIQYFS